MVALQELVDRLQEDHENAKLLNELVGKDANGENRVRVTFGDSKRTLPEFVKLNRNNVLCNLVHVDGGHFGDVPHADLWGMFQLSNRNTLLIMDDLTLESSEKTHIP